MLTLHAVGCVTETEPVSPLPHRCILGGFVEQPLMQPTDRHVFDHGTNNDMRCLFIIWSLMTRL
jgi:hypothetical protein